MTLLLGFLLTAFFAWRTISLNETLRAEFFEEIAAERHYEFIDLVTRTDRFLNSINAMLASHLVESEHDLLQIINVFNGYIGQRDIETEFPGLYSFGLTKRVLPEDLPATIATLKTHYPDFKFKALPRTSEEDPSEHWLVIYSKSSDNTDALGFDSSSDSITYPTILQAMESADFAFTPALQLVENSDNIQINLALLTYLKVDHIDGLVAYSGLFLPNMVNALDAHASSYNAPKHINMAFIDANNRCVYAFTAGEGEVPCVLTDDLRLQHTWRDLQIFYQPTPDFENLVPRQSILPTVSFGIILSVLLAYIVRLTTHRAQDLAFQVTLRTEQLEQEKRNVESAMHATQRFIANMSHELRTPLNAIMGVNQIILAGPCNSQTKRYLDISQDSAQHLLSLINDVLDISKLDDDSLHIVCQPFDVRSILDMTANALTLGCKDRPITPIIELADDLPHFVVGDAKRIKQVLLNLISNALKFTDSGRIVFAVNAQSQADNTTRLSFTVQDSGIGIPASLQQTVFERFKQVDDSNTRRHGGSGLGLAISHKLAEQMGGTLSLISVEGEGSTFVFNLNLMRSASAKPSDDVINRKLAEQALRQRHIVVLDDVDTNNEVSRILLQQYGARVTTFNSPHQAIEYCHNHMADIDALLCDIQMPDLDGLQVTRILRELGFEKPIIGLSGNAYESDFSQAQKAGMDDYLAKPLEILLCISVLEKYLAPLPRINLNSVKSVV